MGKYFVENKTNMYCVHGAPNPKFEIDLSRIILIILNSNQKLILKYFLVLYVL